MILNFITFALSFITAFILLPYFIERLQLSGNTIVDMYKTDTPKIPTHGGLVVLFIVIFVCSLVPLIGKSLGRLSLSYDNIDQLDTSILFHTLYFYKPTVSFVS